MMMRLALLVFLIAGAQFVSAQQKPTDLDSSPLDMSYWPHNYPISKMRGQVTQEPIARLVYSRPQRKGRNIFGGEVKYNEVWRLGANETTEVEFFKNIKVGSKKLLKGKYTLFCIPLENKWTIIFNKELNTWGSFTYNSDKDIARIDVPVQRNTETVEALTMYFDTTPAGTNLIILWEDIKVAMPVAVTT